MSKSFKRVVVVVMWLAFMLVPAVAFAEEAATTAAEPTGIGAWGKPMGAALAIGLAAIAAGMAQARIGSAGQATLAERPEERIWVVTLTALPEVIVLLGFVMAILIAG